MKSLRIAIFTPTFLPKCAGAEIFHHNLANCLALAGHLPSVVVPRRNVRELKSRGWVLPYDIEGYPANLWSYFKHGKRLALWLNRRALSGLQRRHGFDVWHTVVLHPAGVCFADWQVRCGVPGLVRPVGDDVAGLPGHGLEPRVEAIMRETLPKVQAVVALSAGMQDELCRLGVPRERISIMPNAVDCERFASGPDRAALREALGLAPGDFVFLCVARNHPQKDFPTLLRAFRRVVGESKERGCMLVIAGRGARALQEVAATCGVAGRVKLMEFGAQAAPDGIPAMPPQGLVDLYRAADCFVLSSLLEGFSSALLEAMAASLPIVATDAPGIREIVRPGVHGLLSPCGDAENLAAAMLRMADERDLRAQSSEAARRTAMAYSWPAVTDAYAGLYAGLIESAAQGRFGRAP